MLIEMSTDLRCMPPTRACSCTAGAGSAAGLQAARAGSHDSSCAGRCAAQAEVGLHVKLAGAAADGQADTVRSARRASGGPRLSGSQVWQRCQLMLLQFPFCVMLQQFPAR
jgi:hypothetical protein